MVCIMEDSEKWFPAGIKGARDSFKVVVPLIGEAVKGKGVPSVTEISRKTRSPFKVLVSTVISARTKDEVTADVSRRLFAEADTPEKLAQLSEKKIARLIYPAGFYRVKAKNLRAMAIMIVERFGGRVPQTIDELTTLPGVGRKTANLVLTLAFCKDAICVDTHVHRIVNRIGVLKTSTPVETEFALRKALPKKFWAEINDLLVTYGKKVCTPMSPRCSICVIDAYCKRVGVTRSR